MELPGIDGTSKLHSDDTDNLCNNIDSSLDSANNNEKVDIESGAAIDNEEEDDDMNYPEGTPEY